MVLPEFTSRVFCFQAFYYICFYIFEAIICTFQSKFGLGNKNTCFFRECFISAEGAGPVHGVRQRTEPRDGHFFCISSSHCKGVEFNLQPQR